VATKVVIYGRVIWAIDSFASYKTPEMDGIFPALFQRDRRYIFLTWSGFLVSAWQLAPATWRPVKVLFLPKPGKDSYGGPKEYRTISLTLFLLKTWERLIDRFLRDKILTSMSLHPKQHAYQAIKSVEATLYQLV
jgi:hypothetical protein